MPDVSLKLILVTKKLIIEALFKWFSLRMADMHC